MKKFILCCACSVMLASPVWADGLDMLGRTSVSVSDSQDGDAAFEIETIQPISQTAETLKHTVFFQGRLASQNSDETINVGIGYRNLADDENIIYGINAFYDATTEYDHRRASLGLEAIGKRYSLRANIYSALSNEKKKVSGAVTTYQSALDGYDFSLDMPMPYLPWMRLQATGYKWEALKDFDDISGSRLTLLGNLTNQISFEVGADDNNYQGTDNFVKLTYNLNGHAGNGITATLADGETVGEAGERNLRDHLLDKVVRNNNIVVQTRGGVVIGRSN